MDICYGYTKDRTKCMWVACGLHNLCGFQKHSQLFVMVFQVSHPAEQCTTDDL